MQLWRQMTIKKETKNTAVTHQRTSLDIFSDMLFCRLGWTCALIGDVTVILLHCVHGLSF